MRARDFIDLASRGLAAEDQVGVLQRVQGQLQAAVGSYAEPGWAASTGWSSVTSTLRELASSAPQGSDTQLSAVQSLCAAQLDSALLGEVAGWRDGSAPLPGLTVDTDLSWTLLGALVAHGAAGVAEIEAAERADPTASGQRRAMQVRSLIPTAESKAAIWDRLINDDGMANALQDAAIAGFVHPAQLALLTPFTERYFEVVAQVWDRRSSEVAQKVAVGLFPRWAVEQSTVDRALAWADADNPAALKRLVSEGRAGVERALRARAADAG